MPKVYKHTEGAIKTGVGVHTYRHSHKKTTSSLFHIHHFYELEVIIEGSGVNRFKDLDQPIVSGSAYIIAPPIGHKIEFFSDSTVLTISFSNSAIKYPALLNAIKHKCNYCNLSKEDLEKVLEYALGIDRLRDSTGIYAEETRSALLSLILITVLNNAKIYSAYMGSSTPPKLQQAIDYIYNNSTRDISLSEVAEKVSLSPNHLGHIFLKNVGITYSNFLLQLRLENAKTMLNDTNLPLSEVSRAVGFNSTSYFIKKFKTHYGTTPRNFKK